jgi:hypothetical protein
MHPTITWALCGVVAVWGVGWIAAALNTPPEDAEVHAWSTPSDQI